MNTWKEILGIACRPPMHRVFFERAAGGYRTVRGGLVRRIQLKLKEAGSDPGDTDGIYGSDTETALKAFQRREGLQENGKVTGETWLRLVQTASPPIFERCLQLTADFEGHGFQKVAGNFDGAGLTWGIIGFTLKHGEIQSILGKVRQSYPALLDQAFGSLKEELARVLTLSRTEQIEWASGISIGSQKYRIEQPWEDAFRTLGNFSEVQQIQLECAGKYWQTAMRDAERFQLETELGIALCFDIAVQNGGIDFGDEERRIRKWFDNNQGASERDRRLLIADVVAENSRTQYIEDVRQRKRTIAEGEGRVHDARYAIGNWGIANHPWRS